MNAQKLLLLALVLFLMLPLPLVLAAKDYTFQDRLSDGVSVFFLVDLEEYDVIKVWVQPEEHGQLAVFLFDERPY